MRALSALALQAVVFAAMGCLAISNVDYVATPTPPVTDRHDCGEMLGTAFRSSAEQSWFAANCSAWAGTTLGRVAGPTETPAAEPSPGVGGSSQGGSDPEADSTPVLQEGEQDEDGEDDSQRCDDLRGRPYERPGDREWFLENCNNVNVVTTNASESADCARIQGQAYASQDQRAWFLANCVSQGPVSAGPANQSPGSPDAGQGPVNAGPGNQSPVGPDGRSCNEIYGTRYRSRNERTWFSQNC